ncbi:toll/interleukin-1 receptor domain-containing protein [Dictyobacter kobayashii]|uniref:TIR domain-containing protein n=1 Tax=Dictyobacter kobayashii TaxID=2014872 RepID=A0A402AXQ7_9CHLR|nr:toll/interleukin-1 receptor domain-containing protein [Dictyobacter kobayashii]GCE23896.1 hypothetical protein KDK_76960 [Dictyobacter kobayashii]
MPASPSQPLEIFISYAHRDKALLKELEKHLSNLKQQGLITSWQDHAIRAGDEWEKTIALHLETAEIIFLLISADFLASEYCTSVELARALERHRRHEARVIPVIVRPCDWQGSAFESLQCLPRNARPITSWEQRDEAFLDVVSGLRTIIDELHTQRTKTPTRQMILHNLPYERNLFFTGRDDVLDRLHTSFQTMQTTQAISGLGGIGKTQTAIEYAYRYQGEYSTILWTQADSREALLSSIDEIAQYLNLPERQEQNQPLLLQAVKLWLQTHKDWLLVLDNADDLSIMRDIIPTAPQGHILLTTRTQITGKTAHRVEIEQMADSEGLYFCCGGPRYSS